MVTPRPATFFLAGDTDDSAALSKNLPSRLVYMRIVLVWLENQTGEDTDFIFRGIGYDGTEYWAQVRRMAKIRRSNVKRK
ncbi:MAG: hypothetical protein ACSW8H_02825, partial [bacterium]